MIRKFASSFFRAHVGTAHVTALLGLAGAAFLPAAHAAPSFDPAAVTPGDTYSIEVVGYNTATPTNDIYLILPSLTPTFGTTTSYANDALNGQTLTVTSTESVANGITTDSFSFTVPTNFVPAGTVDNGGSTLNAIQFSVGNYFGGTNTVDLTLAGTAFAATSTATFKFNGATTTSSSAATVTPSNSNKSYSSFGETFVATGDISNNDVTGLNLTITYVPEPSTNAAVLLGAAGLLGVIVVRNRRAARA